MVLRFDLIQSFFNIKLSFIYILNPELYTNQSWYSTLPICITTTFKKYALAIILIEILKMLMRRRKARAKSSTNKVSVEK